VTSGNANGHHTRGGFLRRHDAVQWKIMTSSSNEPPGVPSFVWRPPRPAELPAVRRAVADHMRTPFQHQATSNALASQRGTMPSMTGDLRSDAAQLLDQERERLMSAELFCVTGDMTRLALAAAETLPVHSLHPEDVPARHGFIVFAEPIGAYQPDEPHPEMDHPVTIVAASWGPTEGVVPGRPGVWITFWSAIDNAREIPVIMKHRGITREKAGRLLRQTRGELDWDNEVITRFGADGIAVVDQQPTGTQIHAEDFAKTHVGWDYVKNTTAAWAQIVRATWLLITQPGVTDVEEQPLSRTVRRRDEREGYNPSAVRVVRIRDRADTPTREQDTHRNYRVRWTVRGLNRTSLSVIGSSGVTEPGYRSCEDA
jgi:hypothetical protein